MMRRSSDNIADSQVVPDKVQDLDGLILSLKSEIEPMVGALRKKQPVDAVKQLGEALYNLGELHNVVKLCEFGENLLDSINNFDIMNVRRLIGEFDGLADRLYGLMK